MLYEWLRDYQRLIEEIDYLEFNLERSEVELKRWVSGDLQGVRLEKDSNGSKLEDIIKQLKLDINFKKKQLTDLMNLVDKFKGLDNQILKLKYISGLTLESIALELNYSPNYIKRKHAEIMKIIKFVDAI